jgi:hypothetical protein
VVEGDTPQAMDVAGECLLYDGHMTRVYLADAQVSERAALRLLLLDLKLEIAGEAADWFTALSQAPLSHSDMLLVDWSSSSSAIWTPAIKQPSLLVPMHLSVKAKRLSGWLNVCLLSLQAFRSNEVSWLRKVMKYPAHIAAPSAGVNRGSIIK